MIRERQCCERERRPKNSVILELRMTKKSGRRWRLKRNANRAICRILCLVPRMNSRTRGPSRACVMECLVASA